jgi:DNA repair protein RecN (Recombination protein N)
MLLELQISDFAIIERLHLRLERGFNVLTGETGAGKSIIIDALGTLRGEKTDPTFVRAGSSRARIEGIFSVDDCPGLVALLQDYGLWDDNDEHVILTREISAESGRSVARINGRAVNTGVLRDIGGRLVDIHGQHEGLSLFNTRTHLDMLDSYGDLWLLRDQVSTYFSQLRQVREELAELRRNEARRVERLKELQFLIEDVSAAKLQPGEEAELLRERAVLQNSVRITDLVSSAYALLYQGEEGGRYPFRPIAETMATVANDLAELARLDQAVESIASHAEDLRYQLEDLATSVRSYRDQLDFDPGRLDAIEDRLTVLRDLQRKYGGDIAQILERFANAEAEIERLTHSAEHIADLEQRETRLLVEFGAKAHELSQRRRTTGNTLAEQIEAAMGDLAMPHVRFHTSITQSSDLRGVPAPGEHESVKESGDRHDTQLSMLAAPRYAFDKTGIDQVEFLISPNPGEPLKPLARIASGGESARLLLALKAILSRVDLVPTLVFDEIDVGVGGRAGQVVGQKLWGMTEAHQVVCITHLPQVAAFADTHFAISKEFGAERTNTNIRLLTLEERIDELAAMLDGTPVSEHSRANAREIIERAATQKHYRETTNGPQDQRTVAQDQHYDLQTATSNC